MLTRSINALAITAALGLSMLASFGETSSALAPPVGSAVVSPSEVQLVRLPRGGRALRDAGGYAVPLGDYRRIVGGSLVADELLLALCEPDRIAAFSSHSAERAPARHRFQGKPAFDGVQALEQVLSLRPDLIVTNDLSDPQAIARLRERGIAVFDLGPMRGMQSLPANVAQLSLLLGVPERGGPYLRTLTRRLDAVAAGVPTAQRKRALYVSVYGDRLYGGTIGTSYHDVLSAAGLVDVAAERYRDWPAYTPEELLQLDPELVVTSEAMARPLCALVGLERLRACSQRGAILELDTDLISHAGPPLLDAAERLHDLVFAADNADYVALEEAPAHD